MGTEARLSYKPKKTGWTPKHPTRCSRTEFLARLAGFEPTTPWFVAKYSIQLSYSRGAAKYISAPLWPRRCRRATFSRSPRRPGRSAARAPRRLRRAPAARACARRGGAPRAPGRGRRRPASSGRRALPHSHAPAKAAPTAACTARFVRKAMLRRFDARQPVGADASQAGGQRQRDLRALLGAEIAQSIPQRAQPLAAVGRARPARAARRAARAATKASLRSASSSAAQARRS